MPPKKREKDLDGQKGPRMDQIQADHELFLQAFESKLKTHTHTARALYTQHGLSSLPSTLDIARRAISANPTFPSDDPPDDP